MQLSSIEPAVVILTEKEVEVSVNNIYVYPSEKLRPPSHCKQ